MRVALFYHSLVSDWNHGNAHFLRGIASELLARGHEVRVYEPAGGWSLSHLRAEYGEAPVREFHAAFPQLASVFYDAAALDLDRMLDGVDLAIVHEWNDAGLVRRIGEHRRGGLLLFHDTHHRAVSDESWPPPLDGYDGVLAYGAVLRDLYHARGRAARAFTWHEAADTRVFRPLQRGAFEGDLVWIGNWGDDERTDEIREFLIEPVRRLNLRARVYGVRYPAAAREALADAGIEYCGWLPNYRAPEVFARFRATVHIPRRPYAESLPGIPTIRVFEALACGMPLVSAPWNDVEGLFTPGRDFLMARDGWEMTSALETMLRDDKLARGLAAHGLGTVLARHTCAHRVDELLAICEQLAGVPA